MKKILALACLGALLGVADAQESVTPSVPDRAWTRGWWLARFDAKRALAGKGGYDVVFLGDSITHYWETSGSNVWAKSFAGAECRALNCGFSGDRTEHLLWRLDHGQLADLKPKAFVLMIGTNNTGHREAWQESPLDTVLGVQSVLDRLAKGYPDAKVILHPIFPRGAATNDPMRVRNDVVNAAIRRFADGKRVLWCDFNAQLLTADGTLERTTAPDLLHPGESGYAIWAESLRPFLDFALGRTKTPPKPCAGTAPTALPTDGPRTVRPVPSDYWLVRMSRLRDKRASERANAERYYDMILLGDSITQFWETRGVFYEVFCKRFAPYKALNLGMGGDTTQNLLWNVRHGGFLDAVQTRLVVLMIGTNNTWGDSAADIAAGISACVAAVREKQPQAKILLCSLLPREVAHKRGETDYRRNDPHADEIMPKQTEVNARIRSLADGEKVVYVDLVPRFTDAEGLPDVRLLRDGTHPNPAGYEAMADILLPFCRRILGR